MSRLFGLAVMLAACKVQLADNADGGGLFSADAGVSDSTSGDAVVTLGPWGTPMKHPRASSATLAEDDGALRFDGLEMTFSVANAADGNLKDLFVTTRASLTDAWTPATKLSFSVIGASDETPRFSADGLTLYFASGRPGGAGLLDIYSVTRTALTTAWNAPTLVSGPNSALLEKTYTPCGTTYLVIRDGEIAEGTIGAAPTINTTLSDPATPETGPFMTPDCLTTYFASARGGGATKLYMSTRTSTGAAWTTPAVFAEFAALGGEQEDPWLSPDGRIFSFAMSTAATTKDQYLVTRQ